MSENFLDKIWAEDDVEFSKLVTTKNSGCNNLYNNCGICPDSTFVPLFDNKHDLKRNITLQKLYN